MKTRIERLCPYKVGDKFMDKYGRSFVIVAILDSDELNMPLIIFEPTTVLIAVQRVMFSLEFGLCLDLKEFFLEKK